MSSIQNQISNNSSEACAINNYIIIITIMTIYTGASSVAKLDFGSTFWFQLFDTSCEFASSHFLNLWKSMLNPCRQGSHSENERGNKGNPPQK